MVTPYCIVSVDMVQYAPSRRWNTYDKRENRFCRLRNAHEPKGSCIPSLRGRFCFVMTTYRYKMYDRAKDGRLDRLVNRYGILHNHVVALYRRYDKLFGKSAQKYAVMAHMACLRKRCAKWRELCDGMDAQAMQNVVERIDKSYKAFFRWVKNRSGNKFSPPKFKKVKKYKSFTLKQCGYKFDFAKSKIRICGKWYGYFNSRAIQGKVKTVTVKRDSVGDFFLYVVTDYVKTEEMPQSGKSVGYDFGMKHFLTDNDGNRIDAPLFMQRHRKEQNKLHRALSRKKLHSRGWWKCKERLARFNRKVARKRDDFQWKLAREIVKKYDLICVEDLNLVGMARFRFGRKVGEYGFASFVSKLEYLAAVMGKKVVKVGRYFASSQLCHECGYQHKGLTLKDREWTCPKCGTRHDRDVNAAINILTEGASSVGEGSSKTDSLRKEVAA